MYFIKQAIIASSLLAVAHGQAILLAARGSKGSPISRGLQVDSSSTDDANIISDVEISTNVVNECGRTVLAGNIDIGEQTENALADGNVTETTAGSRVAVLIQQVNATGAGPFTCDMDPTGNSIGASGQTQLRVKESSANKNGVITLRVTMPNNLQCTGSSAGNQTDVKAGENDPTTIGTIQQLDNVLKQVQQNVADLPAALEGIAEAEQSPADQGTTVVDKIQAADPSTVDN
ncbi:hypothetical protein E0Z10_g6640 [Xylaria hypoxylon]|uniref:Uncharacterized protein n=1 Tax=Xylaria hypoxylon TaxID=37992 RepID=A0A4Z0YSR4_9PEZI|nr:hypothetical protein E0Z10_g6640 [Xylaria hypoxylon]